MKPDEKMRYISIREFSETTGISPSECKTHYAVNVDGSLVIPRFMLDCAPVKSEFCEDAGGHDLKVVERVESSENTECVSVSHVTDSLDGSDTADALNIMDSSGIADTPDTTENLQSAIDPFERLKNRIRLAHSEMQASATARFFARTLDLVVFAIPTTYVFLLLINSPIDASSPSQLLIAVIVVASLSIVIALFLDALCYVLAGNTPGKAILKLRVSDSSSHPLSFKDYLFRNFSVLARGLGFMIFPVILLTLFRQFRRVSNNRPTSYDLQRGTLVKDVSSGI